MYMYVQGKLDHTGPGGPRGTLQNYFSKINVIMSLTSEPPPSFLLSVMAKVADRHTCIYLEDNRLVSPAISIFHVLIIEHVPLKGEKGRNNI